MPRIGYCDAGIEVDGRRLEEYGTQVDGKTVTTWVESEAGKQFSIVFRASGITSSLAPTIHMDGSCVQKSVYLHSSMGKRLRYSTVQVNKDTARPFLFSTMKLTDDENLASPNGISEDFGTVKITVERGTTQFSSGPVSITPSMGLENSPVHERTKKVASHRISLGEELKRSTTYYTFTRSPDYPDPVAVFKFIYRSRSFLQAQGLIPPDSPRLQSVEAETSEEIKYEETPSAEDVSARRESRKAIRRLREQQEDIQRRIAELEEAARPSKRIKTEVKPDPEWATYKIDNDGVIDLTTD